jgi:N-acetylglucosaminyldiphosphoundecaprenol N-acetyl-beta-D-mannosaminyltransferase
VSDVTTVGLMGVPVANLAERAVVDRVLAEIRSGRGGWIVTPNVDILRQLDRRSELRALVGEADLVVADGMPLVWASRLQGTPLPERVAGSRLIWSLTAAAADVGATAYLVGGAPGVADRAAEALAAHAPGLIVAGTHCPPFGFERDAAARAAMEQAIVAARPDIVFCGLGFPKQEFVIRDLRPRLPSAWFVGCGASINFVAGAVRRAPEWMQASGLEWLHRLASEPRRLFARYIVHDLPFAVRLLGVSAWKGRRAGPAVSP